MHTATIFELEEALIGADTYSPARPLHPPRLIRAVIDWKIDHPDQEMERFVLQAIQVGLAVYGQKADALDMVDDFEEKIETHIPKLLGNKVRQDRDLVTWCATQPHLSYNSARQLAFQHSGEDILFIALGHGGVAAGMDVFLRYVDITDRLNSIFYAMRFSRNKHHDLIPKLSPQEIELLTQCSEGKQIVLFDEDVTTGHTLNGARAFLETKLQRNDITLKTNQGHGYSNNHH